MMVRILGHGIKNISEGDTDPDPQGDEHGGISTVISMTHEQLVGIGSDKLPSFPWDPRVHLVSRLFHLMMTQAALESHILHSGLVLSGLAGGLSYGVRQFLPFDTHDRVWRWLGRYYFHRGTFTNATSG
jgi:hypothetical protein